MFFINVLYLSLAPFFCLHPSLHLHYVVVKCLYTKSQLPMGSNFRYDRLVPVPQFLRMCRAEW